MIYRNPVLKGFYPDPSVCRENGKFYLAASSFQYFPGVPLFESSDLVNWKQIGHALTRENQVELKRVRSSGGVFAPTLRCHNGRFYMVTNNNSTNKNFYVYTDNIYDAWSDPIEVDQGGIDPSLFFEEGHCYFISNGTDETGTSGVLQCEIDIATGKKLSPSRRIWAGAGGRYLESPHMYHIGDFYYLMVAEGGTEYGHMVAYARAKSVWGPFENAPNNPVLTNRNKAPYIIQGVGHGDLVQNTDGRWYMVCLGFRQIGEWKPFHTLGRETFLVPVQFDTAGWFTVGRDGTMDEQYEIPGNFKQQSCPTTTFQNTDWKLQWCRLRWPHPENYCLQPDSAVLSGTDITLDDVDSPSFVALRQQNFDVDVSVKLILEEDASSSARLLPEAGLSFYMCETEHYDLCLVRKSDGFHAVLKFNIGPAKHIAQDIVLGNSCADVVLGAKADHLKIDFFVRSGDSESVLLGSGETKYLSSEVAEGFTGIMVGLYAVGKAKAQFREFVMTSRV